MQTLGARILRRLEELGKSPSGASQEAGLERGYIRDILNKKKKGIRGANAEALAKVLQWPVSKLLSEEGDESEEIFQSTLPKPISIRKNAAIQYGGIVGAGPLRQANVFDQDGSARWIPIEPDPQYPISLQSALEVEGDSLDKEDIRPGMWLHVVERHAWERVNGPIGDRMLVVAMAITNAGASKELGAKILRLFLDRVELHPHSTNHAHKPWIMPVNTEDFADQYDVIGVVLKAVKLFQR